MSQFPPSDGLKFTEAGNALDSEWRAAPHPESDVDMSDLYHRHADEIADDLLADPELFEPVSEDFAVNSDEGYGAWMPSGDDGDGSEFDADYDAAYDVDERRGRTLTDDERSDLNEIDRVLSGPRITACWPAPGAALMSTGTTTTCPPMLMFPAPIWARSMRTWTSRGGDSGGST
ncbi:hypothetical protein BVC93_31795 (plasmid) [Mycobacterium sp. MS1601]|uniref:hypothetical protein n=1 Tax=Mycobacterium sp. MS1601 TaxID=1936029 RepID=UPI0009794E5B|nr:hypothetical protein [Mycobacterium sp. MS1601]AQA07075.1 hypothetical protein BVC93_31795 [Mycobacterium sp. MS1601]